MASLQALPKELVGLVFSHLEASEVSKCAVLCKKFRNQAQNQLLWKALVEKDYGSKITHPIPPGYSWKRLYVNLYFEDDQSALRRWNAENEMKKELDFASLPDFCPFVKSSQLHLTNPKNYLLATKCLLQHPEWFVYYSHMKPLVKRTRSCCKISLQNLSARFFILILPFILLICAPSLAVIYNFRDQIPFAIYTYERAELWSTFFIVFISFAFYPAITLLLFLLSFQSTELTAFLSMVIVSLPILFAAGSLMKSLTQFFYFALATIAMGIWAQYFYSVLQIMVFFFCITSYFLVLLLAGSCCVFFYLRGERWRD